MSQVVKTNDETNEWIPSLGNGVRPLIVTIPHSGEEIPPEAPWLNGLPETLLMFDVDRYVDKLYAPALDRLKLPWVTTRWHRYACDLNRLASDVDEDSVVGSRNKSGSFPRGLLWSMTTRGEKLMPRAVDQAAFEGLLKRCFHPFHEAVHFVADKAVPPAVRHETRPLYHLDLHSMPSLGTREHRDPGESRADLVISNQDGKSSSKTFFDLALEAGRSEGFLVSANWPYKGGRITEMYGRPHDGWQTIQIELNRKLYMNEETKRPLAKVFEETQTRVGRVLEYIATRL